MSLTIQIRVIPSSGKQSSTLTSDEHIKIYLKSAPERGKANKELIGFLAKILKISKSHINIIAGANTRKKWIKIEADITKETLCEKLGIQRQTRIA